VAFCRKPVVVLRCISQTSPGEEDTVPIIIYINETFCSLMGFTRVPTRSLSLCVSCPNPAHTYAQDELVGSPISKLAMPDLAFKDEVAKRFLSPYALPLVPSSPPPPGGNSTRLLGWWWWF
jgi:hypothetical protein